VDGTRHVLDAAAQHRVRRVVHCSTAGVHGELKEIPGDEESPFNPGDIYQETKLKGELLAREAFQTGLPGTIFRPVGIYGPGDTRFLKLFRAIHRGRFRMIGPGTARYHLTYVDNLVDGIILCGEEPKALGRTYILAGPRYTTIQELAERVAEAVGRPLPAGRLPLPPVRAAAVCCELMCRGLRVEPPLHRRRLDFFCKDRAFTSARARRELGYVPRHDLADGLERTARWYFQNNYLRGPLPATVPG
jgi:nucleoside-diphosphate-sugar epimerase